MGIRLIDPMGRGVTTYKVDYDPPLDFSWQGQVPSGADLFRTLTKIKFRSQIETTPKISSFAEWIDGEDSCTNRNHDIFSNVNIHTSF